MRWIAGLLPLLFLSCRYFQESEGYEASATRSAIGLEIRTLTTPEGPEGFLELSSSTGRFEIRSEELQPPYPGIPAPQRDRPEERSLVRPGPDGRIYEGRIGGWEREQGPAPAWMIPYDPSTVRHKYAGMAGYFGFDFLIGEREADRVRPLLQFRDIGTHADTGVVDFGLDARGRVHLLAVDVDISRRNRTKVLYLVGNPETHRWEEAWLMHLRPEFTQVANAVLVIGEPSIAFAWTSQEVDPSPGQGVFFIERKADGFTNKFRIDPEGACRIAMARDSSGAILLVYTRDLLAKSVLAKLRRPDGAWTELIELPRLHHLTSAISLFALAPGRFVLREYEWDYSWERRRKEVKIRERLLTVLPAVK